MHMINALLVYKVYSLMLCFFFFSSRRRHTRFDCDWSSDVCSSDLEGVTRLELQANGGVSRFGNEADGIRAFGKGLFGNAAADQERRRVAGVNIFEMAFLIENAEEHGGVAADLRGIAQEAIDMIENARGIGAKSHAGERALKHGGEKRGAESLAGNVSDEKSGAAIAKRENIEVISSHR